MLIVLHTYTTEISHTCEQTLYTLNDIHCTYIHCTYVFTCMQLTFPAEVLEPHQLVGAVHEQGEVVANQVLALLALTLKYLHSYPIYMYMLNKL